MNEEFTIEEINEILQRADVEGSAVTFNQREVDLIIDALQFYKEMNYIGPEVI